MRKRETAKRAVEALKALYPDALCSLESRNAYELLIATRLSAQCTDERVNKVTPALFARYPSPESLAKAELCDVEELIKSCGLYKTKAKDLIGIGKKLCGDFGGIVPDDMDKLLTLPGVGRKTANLVLGDIYGYPAVVADTHFIRLSNRLGLVNTKDPLKVEKEMRKLLPPEDSNGFCHRAVLFGRDICTARRTFCEKCPLAEFCPCAFKLAEKDKK